MEVDRPYDATYSGKIEQGKDRMVAKRHGSLQSRTDSTGACPGEAFYPNPRWPVMDAGTRAHRILKCKSTPQRPAPLPPRYCGRSRPVYRCPRILEVGLLERKPSYINSRAPSKLLWGLESDEKSARFRRVHLICSSVCAIVAFIVTVQAFISDQI
ncbi:hypothetical protein EVAR_265_1 [Eumeta japonica]|uniref:Uncharacterized protein n=1 Tax=Eumeta variegata TaxID=151549 RepID=A0A4C1SCH9_EUMVA|nr:hypothetical protein EVAR_265_1 [Eumeta japonica]